MSGTDGRVETTIYVRAEETFLRQFKRSDSSIYLTELAARENSEIYFY
jgi:hypothetical protein